MHQNNILEHQLRDLSFRAYWTKKRLKQKGSALYGATLDHWEKLNPSSYQAVRRLAGRSSDNGDTALPAYGSTLMCDGIVMRIDERMADPNIRKLVDGRHTLHERRILKEILKPGDRVMELGGGIGMVAITAAKIIGSENVFSYEGNPDLEPLIRDNYALNDVSPTLSMCIVGPEAGEQTFHIASRFSRSSLHKPEGETRPITVPVVAFDEEIARIKPTVLVVDIQGAEVEFFNYADLSTIEKLAVEFHPSMTGLKPISAMRRKLQNEFQFFEQARFGNSFLYVRREFL